MTPFKTLSPEMCQAYFERHTGDAATESRTAISSGWSFPRRASSSETFRGRSWGDVGHEARQPGVRKTCRRVAPIMSPQGNRHPTARSDEVTPLFGQSQRGFHTTRSPPFRRTLAARQTLVVPPMGKSKLDLKKTWSWPRCPTPIQGCVSAFYRRLALVYQTDMCPTRHLANADAVCGGYKVYAVGCRAGDEPWRWTSTGLRWKSILMPTGT